MHLAGVTLNNLTSVLDLSLIGLLSMETTAFVKRRVVWRGKVLDFTRNSETYLSYAIFSLTYIHTYIHTLY